MQSVKFTNPELAKIAEECGLVIEPANPTVTDKEIEFFVEQVIGACIDAVNNTSRHSAITTYDLDVVESTLYHATRAIKERFKL
jgi:hypothetical protein